MSDLFRNHYWFCHKAAQFIPILGVVEKLHQAAFRDTLGQSLFCDPARLDQVTLEQVMDYMKSFYSGSNIGVVGVGVDHKLLVDIAKDITPCGDGSGAKKPAKYHGGEYLKFGHLVILGN